MNKIQIRAEILTLITKLQTTTAVSDEMFAALDNEPDKQAIMDVLLKELQRAKEQKAFVICYILTRLFDKETLVNNLREFIRDRKISDYAKMIAFNLLRDLGSEVKYDDVNGYFTEFDQIVELLTKELKAERAAERARKQVLETEKEINNEKKKRIILADKLKDCQIHGPNSGSVLAICEGDSALGALVQARPIDKVALLPIRGKIISALKHPDEKILQNEEVKAIFSALGCGFFNKYNPNKLNYQYVAVASDSDPDGANISNLIVTLFYYMCPQFLCVTFAEWIDSKRGIYQWSECVGFDWRTGIRKCK